MRLVQATDADSDRLKSFFESVLLPGAIDFSIQKSGSFFDQYRIMSDDFETWMLIDEDDSIAGVGSLVYCEGYVKGEKQTWGYATDLRIRPSRKAIVSWSQHFLPVLESANEKRRCRHVLSALELHDNQAYNILIRPTSHMRRRLPRYLLANRFHVVSLHGRVPLAGKPLAAIRIKPLDMESLEPLCAYVFERSQRRPLASISTPEAFLARIAATPGLQLSDFRIATDANGNILGTAALWDGSTVKRWIPQTYHGFAHTLHQSLKLASLFGLVRGTVEPEHPMPVRYLTHLTCDSVEVFYRLADDAFSRLKPKEFLSYLHFAGHWRTLPPKQYISTALPFGLYHVLSPNTEAPSWPTPNMTALPPDFEISWL